MRKKVVFVHYRTGERDGVGLEIEKRAKVFSKLGYEVWYLSGFDALKRKNSKIIPLFDLRNKQIDLLRQEIFQKGSKTEREVLEGYRLLEEKIARQFKKTLDQLKPDVIYFHNILSYGYNLAATTAIIKVLDKLKIPSVLVNHDFWFEREKFLKPKYKFIKKVLSSLPPQKDYILRQQVINSIALNNLYKRRKISAQMIGDYFDFNHKKPTFDSYNKNLKKDLKINDNELVILQATRITQRKAIENAILFADQLNKLLKSQKVNKKAVLLFSNFIEVDAKEYAEKLKKLIKKLGVRVIWAEDKFQPNRAFKKNKKIYSFWDGYLIADLVTYPSTWEGFGNQFLEAIFFEKLPVVFEYPVFKKDLILEGYEFVSLGDKVHYKDGLAFVSENKIKQAAKRALELLNDPKRLNNILQKNIKIAKKNHDEKLLERDIRLIIKNV